MKCRLTRIFLALSIVAVVMISVSALRADDFKTTTGEEFKNANISRVEPDGIVITYSAGIVKLPFTELPKELQDKYHYDPKGAADFRRQIDEAKASRDEAVAAAKEKTRQFNQSALPSPAPTSIPAAAASQSIRRPSNAAVSVLAQTFRPSSLNLEAHETGTGVSTQHKWETNYGSYDRDYRQQKKIIVTVRDLSRKAPRLVAHVYFIAKPLNGAPRFIYAHSELPVDLNGQLEARAEVGSPDLKSSVQNYVLLGAKYVAGADIDGWIVVGEVNSQTFQIRASNQTLLEMAQDNPRQPDSLAAMIADYEKATERK